MTYSQNFFLHVVCEGKSERNYLAALNRLLRDSGIGLTLLSPNPKKRDEDGGGHFRNVVQKYKDFRRNNRNVQPWIWVDWDLYLRNDQHCMELYESRPKGIPAFLFSIHNFEDFLHYLQTMSGPLFFTLERQYIVLFCADAYSTMRLIMQLRKCIVYLM